MSIQYDLDFIINHLGEEREEYHGATTPPIYQTSNFVYNSVDGLAAAFKDERSHHLYTRGNNPTVQILRKKLAALEKAEDALVFSSGIAAMSMAILSQVKSGDHVICVQNPYSWTIKLLEKYLTKFDVQHTFVDGTNMDAIKSSYQENSTLLILESPNTMTFEVQDLRACAQWARSKGIKSIIDNSYASPLYQNPIELGIDLSVHSGTKFLNGHSDVVFGVICGSLEMLDAIFNAEFMNLGAILGPHEASLIIRGLRTFPIRMERIVKTTMDVFNFLNDADFVEKIYYPGDPEHPSRKLIASQMTACPGLLSIILKETSEDKIKHFVEHLQYFKMAVSWGGHESLIIPMLAAHKAFPDQVHRLPSNFIRLYIGLETSEVLIKDLSQAIMSMNTMV